MNILVWGAGVIGTLYAGRLQEGGHRVTVLARGERLVEIRRHGLVLKDFVHGVSSTAQVATTDRLGPDDQYDVALVTVRRDQLAGVLPGLIANQRIPILVFMLNNPLGWAELSCALGKDRVLLGFPGAGGIREGHVVRYAMITQQPTTIGELGGCETARLRNLVGVFRKSGFPSRTERHMGAWLMVHAFFVTAVSGAIYLAGGDCKRLSRDSAILSLMAEGVREGFAGVRALGLTVTPFPLRVLFTWLPRTFAVYYWRCFFASEMADYVFGGHARTARTEMRQLAQDCRCLLAKSGIEVHALTRLYGAIDAYAAP